jgi:hypothetical protein
LTTASAVGRPNVMEIPRRTAIRASAHTNHSADSVTNAAR